MHQNHRLLNIVTGSISAYKNIDFIRALQAAHVDVEVILTHAAETFIPRHVLSSFCNGKVWDDDWLASECDGHMRHIRLAKWADVILVAPATAGFIAKMAAGMADTLALSTLLASPKPLLIAPAMNPAMWLHPATQANIQTLVHRGAQILGPITGEMACGDVGEGKYMLPDDLLKAVTARLSAQGPLTGKRAVVTLGGTREPIDPVRFLGNTSTGETGALIANELSRQGASVTAIVGHTEMPLPLAGLTVIHARTAQDMLNASLAALPADYYISCAAICDHRPAHYHGQKIKKETAEFTLDLQKNIDVVQTIASHTAHSPTLVIGFALETQDHLPNARKKLHGKNLHGLVLNHAEHLGKGTNTFIILNPHQQTSLGHISKGAMAEALVRMIIDGYFHPAGGARPADL